MALTGGGCNVNGQATAQPDTDAGHRAAAATAAHRLLFRGLCPHVLLLIRTHATPAMCNESELRGT